MSDDNQNITEAVADQPPKEIKNESDWPTKEEWLGLLLLIAAIPLGLFLLYWVVKLILILIGVVIGITLVITAFAALPFIYVFEVMRAYPVQTIGLFLLAALISSKN